MFKPVPQMPPGMSKETYERILKQKRLRGNILGVCLGIGAMCLLAYPFMFVKSQTKLGSNAGSRAGTKSMLTKDYEAVYGEKKN
jgi:anthranilate/para-aminobenzoate synthase component II